MNNKKFAVIGTFALFLIIVTAFGYFYLANQKKSQENFAPAEIVKAEITPLPMPTLSSESEVNILLLGQGDPSHEGSTLTDSMMIAHLDNENKKAALIFLPRDIWVNLPEKVSGRTETKINEIYSLGLKESGYDFGLKLAEQTVSALTDISIQYAVLIDFNGFAQVIDSLGGIEVQIKKAFDDPYYPIAGKELDNCGMSPEQLRDINATMSGFLLEKQYTCRYERLHFEVGKAKMDGATALKYARSRHGTDGSDFARGERQQLILLGVKDKLLSQKALENVDKIYNQFIKKLRTDLDLNAAKTIAELIISPKEYQISQVVLSTENVLIDSRSSSGQFILVPKMGNGNFSELQNFIKNGIK